MGGSGDADNGHHTKADLVNGRFNTTPARRQNGGFVIIEGALVEEVGFGAANAAVARLNRPGQAFVPADGGAGGVRDRALAANLVQAVAELRAFVIEVLDELTGVEVTAAIALVVPRLMELSNSVPSISVPS